MNDLVREDYVLGNKKIVVGDNLHDLVLENLGKIWVRYGNGYKEFSNFVSTLSKSVVDKTKVIIEENGMLAPEAYKDGFLIFDAKKRNLYLKYGDALLLLLEYNGDINEKYVYKTGDTMTGPLTIDVKRGAPLFVKSATLVTNLNAEYLSGHPAEDFALKDKDETITGNWTTRGNWVNNGANIHNGLNTFNNQVTVNGHLQENSTSEFLGKANFEDEIEVARQATFKSSGTAIKVGTGDIVTDGSIGSSQFMSGMSGYGWRLDADTNTLTIDNLIVRGVLNVFELVVNKITATNGSFWITDSFKIDKVHKINYLNSSDYTIQNATDYYNFIKLFNEDDYYVIYNDGFNKTEIDLSEVENHPFAQRSVQEPNVDTKIFDKFKYIFKITDLGKFRNLFECAKTLNESIERERLTIQKIINILSELYGLQPGDTVDEIVMFNNVYDEVYEISDLTDMLRFEGNTPGFLILSAERDKISLVPKSMTVDEIDPEATIVTVNELSLEIEVLMNVVEEHIDYSTCNLLNICNNQTLYSLHNNNIIQLSNMFQSTPERISDLETIGENITIYPDDDTLKFEELYYTVVDASKATLNNGQYLYSADALSHINLYCKYFASNLEYDMRTFVLEAKHDEFPVFKPGDILKCQKFTGKSIKQYHALVLGIIGDYSYVILLLNSSVVLEGTMYNYNVDGTLSQSESNLDKTLYNRSPELNVDLSNYLSQARLFLTLYYADHTSISQENFEWALAVLFTSEDIDTLRDWISEGTISLSEALTYAIDGMTYEECLQHPIFKKAFEESVTGLPEKDDALVRIGSIMFSDRRNSMYLTSSEQNSPYTDVLVGVNRPDYTVIYLTPKYVRFEASLNIDGEVRKGVYYVLDNAFSTAIKNMLNGNTSAVSLKLKNLYNKYSAFITSIQGTSDPNAELRSVVLTYIPNENTIYDINGDPMTQSVNGDSYFVSLDLENGIINGETSLNTLDSDKCSNYKINEDVSITLLIGGQ